MDALWEAIGVLAAALTSAGFLPQILKGFKTKRMADVSLPMVLTLFSGVFLWLLYGIYLENLIIIGANLFGLLSLALTLALKLRYS